MERLIAHSRRLLAFEEPLILAGDFNVIPEPRDAADPALWLTDALYLPADPRQIPRAAGARLHRRAARRHRRSGPLHVLGLSGRRLAAQQRHPHRPSPDVAAGRRPPARRRGRQIYAGARQAVRSHARMGRAQRQLTVAALAATTAHRPVSSAEGASGAWGPQALRSKARSSPADRWREKSPRAPRRGEPLLYPCPTGPCP